MHDDIRENNAAEPSPLRASTLFRDAHRILFAPGVQMRMTLGILVCALFVFLPIILYSFLLALGGAESYDPDTASAFASLCYVLSTLVGTVLFFGGEIFVALPMLLSLPMMAEKAVRGESLSLSDVFLVFRRKRYRRSFLALLFAGVLNAAPIALFLSSVYGAVTIYAVVRLNPSTEPYLPYVVVFCAVVCLITLAIALVLSIPGYYYLAFRVKMPVSGRLYIRLGEVKGSFFSYLALRCRFLLLHLVSICSVCALYPIYTIPMYLIVAALSAERMQEIRDN